MAALDRAGAHASAAPERLLPLPIAGLLRKANNSEETKHRHDSAWAAWEASVRLAFAAEPPADVSAFALPSLGHWVAALGKRDERLDAPEILAVFALLTEVASGKASRPRTVTGSDLLSRLAPYRNPEVGHGAPRGPEYYGPASDVLLAGLEKAWELGVFWPAGAKLVHVNRVEIDAEGARRARILSLSGLGSVALGRQPVVDHVLPSRLYRHAGAEHRALHPWLLFQASDVRERVLFFNGVKGPGRFAYLDYASGEHVRSADLADLFPSLGADLEALFANVPSRRAPLAEPAVPAVTTGGPSVAPALPTLGGPPPAFVPPRPRSSGSAVSVAPAPPVTWPRATFPPTPSTPGPGIAVAATQAAASQPPIPFAGVVSPMERLVLVVEEGPNPGERLPLPMGVVAVVGRATDAQVRLPEDDKKVSRYQAMLEVRAAGVEVQDLNSRNGTFVNGARVARGRLGVGDVLRLGRTSFRLAAADIARAPTLAAAPAVTEAEVTEPESPSDEGGSPSAALGSAPKPPGGELFVVAPRVVPTLARSAPTCAVCGATLLNLQPAAWDTCTFLCDACAARIRAGRRGDEPAELGGFEVLRFLESGGMGTVYEGRQRGTGVRAALKVLCPELGSGHPLARRFLREQRLHGSLVHDRIVRCYSVSTLPGRSEVCIAMEFVPGGSADRVARRTSNLRQMVVLAADLFEGLAYGHERGLVHRDVKPANLLLTLPDASGVVRAKLSDYGLAKNLQEAGGGTTGTGFVAGSPFFVAPEQLLDLKRVGTSADIYGASATVYALLAGASALAVPDDKTDVATVCAAVLDAARVPLRQRRPDVPAPLADWLDAMLLRDPVHQSRVRAAEVPPWLRGFG